MYIRRSKIPSHIYVSISTCKNQRTKARGALYISTYEYNYKVITGCDRILQEYYITDMCNAGFQRDIQVWTIQKELMSYRRKNSRDEQGAWKYRASDGMSLIHAFTTYLWSATGRIHKLQSSEIWLWGPEESKLPNEWCGECQVACRDMHTCIDKSK